MPTNDYLFEFPKIRGTDQDYITSYDFDILDSVVSTQCGKYTIKRKVRSNAIYKINIELNDILISDSDRIKLFFERFHFSGYFDISIDNVMYDAKFSSFSIDYSDLHNRHNIKFSVVGSIIAT